MNVVFRVDSSAKIGSGHLMRCLTLASRLRVRDFVDIFFVSRDLKGNLNDKVTEAGYHLIVLPERAVDKSLTGYAAWLTVTQEQDAVETIAALGCIGAVERLVIDSYAIDETWEKMLRSYVREIFVVDDLANRRHDCDILLDYGLSPGKEEKYKRLVPDGCRLLIGVRYALVRDEFLVARKNLRPFKEVVKNILIFYGGADVTNETQKAIDVLTQMSVPGLKVEVIVGSSNPHKESIKKFCACFEFIYYYEQVSNMAEFMSRADVLICAGGTTLLEAMYLQLPAIVTAVAENQREAAEYGASLGLIEYLGFYDQVSNLDIAQALQRLTLKKRSEIADKCEEILGMHRIEC